MRNIFSFCLFIVILFAPVTGFAGDTNKYDVGQGWVIQSGPYQGQEVIISFVERFDDIPDIYHISVYGPIENSEGLVLSAAPHFPFAEEGLDKSDLKFSKVYESVPEDWREGYEIWKEAFDKGEAGVFTVSVSDAVDIIFQMIPRENTAKQ